MWCKLCGCTYPDHAKGCAYAEPALSSGLDVNDPQPAPVRNKHPPVWNAVILDMYNRDYIGKEKYGTQLQPHNGRDFLMDAYQEALDLVVYLRGAIYERDGA